MPSKRSGKGSPAELASTPTDYRAWKTHASALLERQGISAGAIPEKAWRGLYINRQATPEEAVEEPRVHYENFIRRPPFAPRKR
jgi:hypothetical protein